MKNLNTFFHNYALNVVPLFFISRLPLPNETLQQDIPFLKEKKYASFMEKKN